MYTLVNNTSQKNLLDELTQSLEGCRRFYFNVAFVSYSGVQLLLDSFKLAEDKGITGKIITGTYLNFTDPKAVRKLKTFNDFDVRVFLATETQGFHPKAYIFEYDDYYKVIVGSSNLTNYALKSNIEWNLQVIAKTNDSNEEFLNYLKDSFDQIWDSSLETTEDFLLQYEKHYRGVRYQDLVNSPDIDTRKVFTYPLGPRLTPNSMQKSAMEELALLRETGSQRALAVAATGTGKTFMAAFDVQQVKPKKMLFLVHREMILEKAMESFAKVVNVPKNKMGLLTGNKKSYDADYLFATIQTMGREFYSYRPDEFEYIVVDEAHHATSPSYQKVLEHFKPKFLLGMTATPERSDQGNVFDLFDNNLAIDIRLRQALEENLLVPFHYYGITDQTNVDLSNDKLTPDQIAEKLNVTSRVDYIIEKMNFYGHDGPKRKALGFCITKKHAEFMAEEFNKRGIPSAYLTGEHSEAERMRQIKLLESDTDKLNIIFTVDIFNEGIDIPSVNTVLMLRPTESAIVFTQQLGRGLRKAEQKEFLTVLDFIGNYSKSFLIAIALYGSRSVTKKEITHAVRKGFRNIPGPTNIRMDEIAQNQILEQLENENFYALKYLIEDYQAFKSALAGKIPFRLQDYLTLEGAPDPVLFFSKSVLNNKSDNYIEFLQKVEKNNDLVQKLASNKGFMEVYTKLLSYFPLKRPHEFAILELCFSQDHFTLDEALQQVNRYVEGEQSDATKHALETFNLNYADINEIHGIKIVEEVADNQYAFNKDLLKCLKDEEAGPFISDAIHYGLMRYRNEFGHENLGYPFLRLYSEYSQREVGMMANYRNTHSSFRGSTLQNKLGGNHYFLFIDLHKEVNIDESINYKDKFITQKQFQWESPNATRANSERGKDLTENHSRGKTIHLFVRKFKTVNNVTQRFTYIGQANAISHQNEKPIEIQYQLEDKMPIELYQEFEPEKAVF
ncbi:DEAD/DEAH box helicase [Jeotgalibaca sp. A127]|uniref:DEAD/DEAH box helicase n=1 Tax=Jeotgalibaca sp. A127 TaxID=3457324 RepID=UPI003FD3D1A8